MDELGKVQKVRDEFQQKAREINQDRLAVKSEFWAQTDETESRVNLLTEYNRLYKTRSKLDMGEIMEAQASLRNTIYEIELQKLHPWDRLVHRFETAMMKAQIKRDNKLKLKREIEMNKTISGEANFDTTPIPEAKVEVIVETEAEIEVVKPDPKYFAKKEKEKK